MDEANEHVHKLDGSGAKLPGSKQNRIRQVKNLIVFQVIKDWHELQEALEIWKICRFKWIHLFQLKRREQNAYLEGSYTGVSILFTLILGLRINVSAFGD